MKNVKYLLIVVLLLSNLISFSQNQNIENDTITSDNILAEEIVFDSNDSDEGLLSLRNAFKKQNITIEISNIKRDRTNKIIAIDIVMESTDGRISKLNYNKLKPVKAIKIFVDKRNNPDWDFGIEELFEEIQYSK
ncbi:hypothetical protein [Flavobacterium sp.]|uniref:hypothetical protein n=1 Tax=Flavobacterium sp. TaxID=239 RepID=UPI000EE11316|nr:hypothetical protein [Flavobacterium sp.]HCQ13027.1 hypothetical protein [Flavobacterium sp.]